MNPAIWGIIGAVIGASASIITTILTNNSSNNFQLKIEKLKREDIARQFQRQNLLSIQEKFYMLYRLVGKVHIHDTSNFEKTGEWRNQNLELSLDKELTDSLREISYLIERVGNDELRMKLSEIKTLLADVCIAKSIQEQQSLLQKSSNDFKIVMEKTGKDLRNNF